MTPDLPTPYFLISEDRLLANLRRVERLRQRSGAKVVLALKCFSTWGVFDILRPYLDGTTSSSVYEARLGHEMFGGETHGYAVAYSPADADEVDRYADKVIFNSVSQFESLAPRLRRCPSVGLRINPGVSYARQTLADPARPYSRLGTRPADLTPAVLARLHGAMLHFNCENRDINAIRDHLAHIGRVCAPVLDRVEWVSLEQSVTNKSARDSLETSSRSVRIGEGAGTRASPRRRPGGPVIGGRQPAQRLVPSAWWGRSSLKCWTYSVRICHRCGPSRVALCRSAR